MIKTNETEVTIIIYDYPTAKILYIIRTNLTKLSGGSFPNCKI